MKSAIILLVFFFIIPHVSGLVDAATVTVTPDKSLQSAVNNAVSGDTINVASGNYDERVTIGKTLTVICLSVNGCSNLGFIVTGNNVVIRGFNITTAKSWSDNYGINISGDNCVIQNNNIHDTARDGIHLGTSSDNCRISDNIIARTSQSGIEIHGNNHIVSANDISDIYQQPPGSGCPLPSDQCDADGIRYFGGGHMISHNHIHDLHYNTAYNIDPHIDCFQTWNDLNRGIAHDIVFEGNFCNNPERGGGFAGKAWDMGASENNRITNLIMKNNIVYSTFIANIHETDGIYFVNNTFVGRSGFDKNEGIKLLNDNRNVVIKNNIFYNQTQAGIGAYYISNTTTNTNLSIDHNCIYQSNSNALKPKNGDVWEQNPLFSGNDFLIPASFKLSSLSPCIDKGTNTSSYGVVTDYSGTGRPKGEAYDMGAYEYSGIEILPTQNQVPGDANGDGKADGVDYIVWLNHYGQNVTGADNGNFNGNNGVDGVDYVVWLNNYGK